MFSAPLRRRCRSRRGRRIACDGSACWCRLPRATRKHRHQIAAFREELQKLGWTEGRDIRLYTRWGREVETRQRFEKELVALQPDLIVSQSTPITAALLQQTRTIPIVFVQVTDPVDSGFATSIPRPGGNVTGFITMEGSIAGKWLELLKEIAPRVDEGRHCVQSGNGDIF